MVRLDFHVISIFCLHCALYKIHTWNLFGKIFARGKIFAGGKIKSGRKKNKTKKKQERKYHFVKKRKENLLRKRLVLSELHAGIQMSNREVAVKPKIAIHDVENEVSFFCMQVPASTKILTIYISSNRNFESCMTIRCLAPQHIFRFSIFAVGFSFAFGNFANYCIVLLNAL